MIEKKGLKQANTSREAFYGKTVSKEKSNKLTNPVKVGSSGKGRNFYGKVT